MIRFFIHRLLSIIPILFGVSIVGFLLMKLVPGDPTFFLLGPYASDSEREVLRKSLGLTSPLPVQYFRWLDGYIHGDFGQSVTYNVPVSQILGERVVNSLILTAAAFAIAAFFGFIGGVLAAIRPYSIGDRIGTILT